MTTQPQLPPGEAPLDPGAVQRLLSSLGADMILVGGQALAFWMARYGITPLAAAISNDGDALGTRGAAEMLASRMGGHLLVPAQRARTAIVAQVRLRKPGGTEANIDVLHHLYTTGGLKKSGEFTRHVMARSVFVQLPDGARFRVMDPFDVLDSRVQNAAGLLEDKGPHVLTQAQWAIELAAAVLLKMARDGRSSDTSAKRLGSAISDVFKLARSRAGRKLLKEHGLDVLSCVDVDTLAELAPAQATQLEKVREAQGDRAGAGQTSAAPAAPAHKKSPLRKTVD